MAVALVALLADLVHLRGTQRDVTSSSGGRKKGLSVNGVEHRGPPRPFRRSCAPAQFSTGRRGMVFSVEGLVEAVLSSARHAPLQARRVPLLP
jgi:hypothetical protein